MTYSTGICMGGKHDKLIKIYRKPEYLEPLLKEPITEVITEKQMREVFERCYSPLTPDILAFTEQDLYVWIGEIKGNNNPPCQGKAHWQINRYLKEAERYKIPARGFIILNDYFEIID